MGLPRWLIGLFDPASREFDREHRRLGHPRPGHGRVFRGGAVMGPGIPGGSRQANPAELAAMSAQAPARRRHFETVLAQVRSDHDEQLRGAAQELRSRGRARVVLPFVTLDAELVTFWRGDRLLRIERTARARGSAGSSLARFPRHDRSDSEEVLAHYLAVSVANDRMNE